MKPLDSTRPKKVVALWALGGAFALAGAIALVVSAARPSEPHGIELWELESIVPEGRDFRRVGSHLALFQAAAVDVAGDENDPAAPVRSLIVPVISEAHPLAAELARIGESHGGVAEIPADALPPLDSVRVFVRTTEYGNAGAVPKKAIKRDGMVGRVVMGDGGLSASEETLFRAAYPGLAVNGVRFVRESPYTRGWSLGLGLFGVAGLVALLAVKARKSHEAHLAANARIAGKRTTVSDDPDAPPVHVSHKPVLPDGRSPGPVPADVAARVPAGGDALGGYLKTYPASKAGLRRAAIMFVVFAALAAACVVLPRVKPPQPGEETLVYGIFYLLAVVSLVFGGGIFATTYFDPGRTFDLFEEGLVEHAGPTSRAVAFKRIGDCHEIDEFKLLTLDRIHLYRFDLDRRSGPVELDTATTAGAEELGDYIQAVVYERLLDQSVTAINAGRKVTWGPLTIDREGISLGVGNTYRWDSIRGLGVARMGRQLLVESGHFPKPTGIRVDGIPNYLALFRLAEQYARG